MANIILITNPNDTDHEKINWMAEELEKRDIQVIKPEMPMTDSYEEWDVNFKKNIEAFAPDTIVIAKGKHGRYLLKEYEERPIGVKGTLIITDDTNKNDKMQELNYEVIKKKSIKFFIYTFQTIKNFTEEESQNLADTLEADLFVLEGADDNSDYEDILIDVISMIEQ